MLKLVKSELGFILIVLRFVVVNEYMLSIIILNGLLLKVFGN